MQNNSCPRRPIAIVTVTISIHAHNNQEAEDRVHELLHNGLRAKAPPEAIAAKTYQDLVQYFDISKPVWCERQLTEEEAIGIRSKPGEIE